MIYLIDQRDSFVYNLLQILREECGACVTLLPEAALPGADLPDADGIILSPGPGVVEEHPATLDLLRRESGVPILGICMGHQEIGTLYGMELYRLDHPQHGIRSRVEWTDGREPMEVGRYHSWALRETVVSREAIEVTARTADGTVMALRHRHLPLEGWQFHPESILTPLGAHLLRHWCAASPGLRRP